jgi:hypothetical protein
VAFDRFLIAYLSRFQPRSLFAELMKHFGCPAKTPRLNDPSTLPMQRIGHQKARGIGEIRSLMDHREAFTPIALEPDTLGESPELFLLPVPTPDLDPAKTLGMRVAKFGGYLINPLPSVLP